MNRMHVIYLRGRLGVIQQHVSHNREANASPMSVGKIHLAYANPGTDPHQAGPRHQPSFRDRAKVVHLQLDRGEAARLAEVVVQRAAHGRVGNAGGDAAVQRSRAVEERGTDPALERETIAVDAHQFQPKQVIEGMVGEELSSYLGGDFRIAQVW